MSRVRICFLGTPEFAVTCLKGLAADEHYEVVGVVTQPDRPAGRRLQLMPSPVKVYAQSRGIPVLAPEKIKSDETLAAIRSWSAEVAVVVAFGQIVPQSFLDLFVFGAVNVHGSLLPRWRGAAPIQRSLEAGETETGVSLQKMVKALDAGDVLGARRIQVDQVMNARELYSQMAELGVDLLHIELMDYIRGNLAPVPQDETRVTYAKKIEKSEAALDLSLSARQLHDRVRAFVMGPGTWILWAGKMLKIHRTFYDQKPVSDAPGTLTRFADDSFWLATGEGSLQVFDVQPESRNRMTALEFIRAASLKVGDRIGVHV